VRLLAVLIDGPLARSLRQRVAGSGAAEIAAPAATRVYFFAFAFVVCFFAAAGFFAAAFVAAVFPPAFLVAGIRSSMNMPNSR